MTQVVHHVDPPPIAMSEGPGPWATYLYTCFLQGLFNHFPLQTFRWEPDLESTEIVIGGEAPINYEAVQRKPHIVVMRGGYEWAHLSLDKMRNTNMNTGNRHHTDLIPGTFTAHCIAETGLEAGRIADLVFRGTTYHKRLLQKSDPANGIHGFQHIGDKLGVSPETSPGDIVRNSSDPEAVMVSVVVPWYLQWTWSAELLVPPQLTTLDLIFGEPRARDVVKPPFVRLNDAELLAHYGVANRDPVTAQFGLRAILRVGP